MAEKEIIVAITGASGAPYALRLIDCLESNGLKIHLIVSPMGGKLLTDECGINKIDAQSLIGRSSTNITIQNYQDLTSPLASGSYPIQGMVICPCSSNTLGGIAAGLGDNLITRAAHVTLKESRRLIVIYREMPVSAINLENMLKLQRAGAVICPASPGFYTKPNTIDDLVDFVVGRILDLLGIDHVLKTRWQQR
ncbi:MAG: UbiX family flavin prenyltransferase [Planctomycetota bacterium]|nr:MAG: UbiX family flavin prenyltransferase [Planctomycetota bacterium]